MTYGTETLKVGVVGGYVDKLGMGTGCGWYFGLGVSRERGGRG